MRTMPWCDMLALSEALRRGDGEEEKGIKQGKTTEKEKERTGKAEGCVLKSGLHISLPTSRGLVTFRFDHQAGPVRRGFSLV